MTETESVTSGPTAPPPKEPKPSVDRIDELARRILTGDILLPKFQRNFVWDRVQIRTLLDSVARGFPIGSVLLWQSTSELRSERRIADLDVELPRPAYPVNYLLDGQQRLSSICGAMYWQPASDPHSRWNLVYDLRRQAFEHLDSLDDPPLHQIRLNKLADATAFFKHVASLDTLGASDKDELKMHAEDLFARFKDYKIATVTLGDLPLEDVAPVFERINSTGTPLTIVDLMRAATWSPDFDLLDQLDEIRDDLVDKGFGTIDRKVILRNVSASSGGGFSTDSIDSLRQRDVDALKSAVEATREAYKRTIDYLVTQIRVPSADVIPYANQITVLAEIFRRIVNPSVDEYSAITQWFWQTALSGYFSGWNTGMMTTDLTAAAQFADGTEPKIQVAVVKPRVDVWRVRQFRANNAHAKLLAILLSYQKPIDLLTGQFIDTTKALAWGNAKEFHHFFPQSYLKGCGESRTRINCLANFIMLTSASNKLISDRAPSDYLADVEAAASSNLDDWLKTNLLSRDAFDAAKNDDYDAFLRYRAETIQTTIFPYAGWSLAEREEESEEDEEQPLETPLGVDLEREEEADTEDQVESED
jgi:hypothetical protein